MIAIDAGFLFGLVDRSDCWHARCVAFLPSQSEGWITTWPVLAEATYLCSRWLGTAPATALMDDVAGGGIGVWNPPSAMYLQVPAMMRKYAALPMDLADATLVLLAEHLGHGRILSTDERDFKTYRWKQRKPFVNLLANEEKRR
ncbi:MAG: VapC toxin family PIN domain ribonuclease [Caldimonas sp.]